MKETNMKCKLFGCDNEASGNFPCCSQEHGIRFKMHKEQIKNAMSVRENARYNGFGDNTGVRGLYTVEMAEYYATV